MMLLISGLLALAGSGDKLKNESISSFKKPWVRLEMALSFYADFNWYSLFSISIQSEDS